jgi:HAD superfamily hydrolase (TIGR01548 family)
MVKDLIVFDMDGVLVEVTESYRATIQATVKHFSNYEPTRTEIQDWKNKGGFNDDWNLSQAMIAERGLTPPFQDIVDHFQALFHGNETTPGLILNEQWIAREGLLERLYETHNLGIFTGRLGWEAQITLDRFTKLPFISIMGVDHVTNPKPHPEGLIRIKETVPHNRIWYVGDTIDDARAGAAAGVPFIGIVAPENPRYDTVVQLLKDNGAVHILDDINAMEAILAPNR